MGLVLTAALTLEVMFLGLTIADDYVASTTRTIGIVTGLMLLLPAGALLGRPVSSLPSPVAAAFFAFGLIALLDLVTEELLVKAHEVPDRAWVTAMFFTGFLTLLALEEPIVWEGFPI